MRIPPIRLPRLPVRRSRAAVEPPDLHLQVQLENGSLLYWRLGADGAFEKCEDPESGVLVSFTQDDVRLRAPKVLTGEAAKTLATRESETLEEMRVVNRSKDGVVYATPESRIERDAGYQVMPGLLLLDALCRRNGTRAPVLTGVLFEGAAARLAVLAAVYETGRAMLSVSVNPENLDSIVTLFAAQAKLPEDYQAVIFSQAEFRAAIAAEGLTFYPGEPEWNGVRLSRIRNATLAAAVVGCVGAAGWAGTGMVTAQLLEREIAKTVAAEHEFTVIAGKRMVEHTIAVGRAVGVDPRRCLAQSEAVWLPDSKVTSRCIVDRNEHRVTVPFSKPVAGQAASPFATIPADRVLALLKMTPPEGCVRDAVLVSGGNNELQVAVGCATADNGLRELGRH